MIDEINTTSEYPGEDTQTLNQKLLDTIKRELELTPTYIALLGFSTIIATLGLLTDSAAVVIGAMLISPLLWPIMGVALSIITTKAHLSRKSVINLIASIVIVVLIAYLVALITPIQELTSEIESRTYPTILDLFIALASSVIGVLAIYYPHISASVSGVAISIALLPPLCVSGIGIAFGSFGIFLGGLLLFSSNAGAIIFSGIITLWFLKFRPIRDEEQKRWWLGIAFSALFLIILSIPLSLFLRDTLKEQEISKIIQETLKNETQKIDPLASIDETSIRVPRFYQDNEVLVDTTLYLPEGSYLTIDAKNQLTQVLSEASNESVNLQLNVVNTVLFRKQEDEALRNTSTRIKDLIKNYLDSIGAGDVIEDIAVIIPPADTGSPIRVTVVLKQVGAQVVKIENKDELIKLLNQEVQDKIDLEIEFIPITRLREQDEAVTTRQLIESTIKNDIALISREAFLDNARIAGFDDQVLSVKALIYLPEGNIITIDQKQAIKTHIEERIEKPIILDIQTVLFQGVGDSLQALEATSSPLAL